MNAPSGLGKLDRKRITALLRETKETVSIDEAARILEIPSSNAGKLLSRWALKGWFCRVKRGVYIPIPLESSTSTIALEDPWIIAKKLYHPCYIGGWSAAEYWGLTEQIFRTLLVKTTQKPKERHPTILGTPFWLITTSEKALFGLKIIWRGQLKVALSDPTRTILDILSDPKLAGGLQPAADIFNEYLHSEHKDVKLLIDYAKRLGNSAVFKRLGFFLEKFATSEHEALKACKAHLKQGNVKLDPSLTSDALVTKWRLWVPKNWKD